MGRIHLENINIERILKTGLSKTLPKLIFSNSSVY